MITLWKCLGFVELGFREIMVSFRAVEQTALRERVFLVEFSMHCQEVIMWFVLEKSWSVDAWSTFRYCFMVIVWVILYYRCFTSIVLLELVCHDLISSYFMNWFYGQQHFCLRNSGKWTQRLHFVFMIWICVYVLASMVIVLLLVKIYWLSSYSIAFSFSRLILLNILVVQSIFTYVCKKYFEVLFYFVLRDKSSVHVISRWLSCPAAEMVDGSRVLYFEQVKYDKFILDMFIFASFLNR